MKFGYGSKCNGEFYRAFFKTEYQYPDGKRRVKVAILEQFCFHKNLVSNQSSMVYTGCDLDTCPLAHINSDPYIRKTVLEHLNGTEKWLVGNGYRVLTTKGEVEQAYAEKRRLENLESQRIKQRKKR